MGSNGLFSSRRAYLRSVIASGVLVPFSGCNWASDETDASETETVVFTDSETATTVTDAPTATQTETKSDQIFDGGGIKSFARAIRTAANLNATLQIEEGTYRFDRHPSDAGQFFHLELSGISDVTIDGNDSTIVFSNPSFGGLRFRNGENVSLRNLSFDYDPVPFTQGEITMYSESNRTITVELDGGFPSLNEGMFDRADEVYALTHAADGGFVEGVRDSGRADKFFTEFESRGNRVFRLHVADRSTFAGIEEGRRLTVVARANGTTVNFYKASNPSLENVTVHTSSGAAFAMEVCGNPTFNDCAVIRPESSDRQLASVADGIRITNCRNGAIIENCRHDMLGDDGIAIDARMVRVQGFESDRTISVNSVHPFVVKVGDILEAMSPSGVVRGELPEIESYEERSPRTPENRTKPAKITFAEPVRETLAVDDYVANSATASAGYVIRNNELRNHRANLIRANSKDGLIEENLLAGVNMNAIEIHSGTRGTWPPKRWVSNVTVRGNTMRDIGLRYISVGNAAAVNIHHETEPGYVTRARPNQDVEVVNNVIENTVSAGIDAEATEGLRIEGNSMSELNQLQLSGYGIALSNVADGDVIGNDVSGSSELLSAFGIQRGCKDISASENSFSLDGNQAESELIEKVPVTFTFNRTVRPVEDGRQLAFRCFSLALVDGSDSVVLEANLGEDESGVTFGEGIDGVEKDDGGTWRWFGPAEQSSILYFFGDDLERAEMLRLEGKAIESGISATVSVGGTVTDEISWDDTDTDIFEIRLER